MPWTECCHIQLHALQQQHWHLCNCRSSSQQQSPLQLKNGEDISKLLPPCYLRDRRDNPHDALPHAFDLTTSPQLQVLPRDSQEPTQGAPCFTGAGIAKENNVTGIWSFQASTRLLSMAEVGIVGMPGPVALTLSGGVNSEGTPIQPATMYAQLTVGEMAKDKLGVAHWLSGTPPPPRPLLMIIACFPLPPMYVTCMEFVRLLSFFKFQKAVLLLAACSAVPSKLSNIKMQAALLMPKSNLVLAVPERVSDSLLPASQFRNSSVTL